MSVDVFLKNRSIDFARNRSTCQNSDNGKQMKGYSGHFQAISAFVTKAAYLFSVKQDLSFVSHQNQSRNNAKTFLK